MAKPISTMERQQRERRGRHTPPQTPQEIKYWPWSCSKQPVPNTPTCWQILAWPQTYSAGAFVASRIMESLIKWNQYPCMPKQSQATNKHLRPFNKRNPQQHITRRTFALWRLTSNTYQGLSGRLERKPPSVLPQQQNQRFRTSSDRRMAKL